ETEQISAFAVSVAKGGLKMKPAPSGACEPLPGRPGQPLDEDGRPMNVLTPPRKLADVRRGEKPSCGLWNHRNGPNIVFVGGEARISALVESLGFWLGAVQVLDRTGVSDRFNFLLQFVLDESTPGPGVRGAVLPPGPDAALDVPRAATIFDALDEQ